MPEKPDVHAVLNLSLKNLGSTLRHLAEKQPSRALSIAITKIEEAEMWLARHGEIARGITAATQDHLNKKDSPNPV